jgi:hypothetical protein
VTRWEQLPRPEGWQHVYTGDRVALLFRTFDREIVTVRLVKESDLVYPGQPDKWEPAGVGVASIAGVSSVHLGGDDPFAWAEETFSRGGA